MELAFRLGRQPTDAEIAAATGLPEEQVREALELTKHLANLDQSMSEDSETPLGDMLPSERPQPEEEVVEVMGNALSMRATSRGSSWRACFPSPTARASRAGACCSPSRADLRAS